MRAVCIDVDKVCDLEAAKPFLRRVVFSFSMKEDMSISIYTKWRWLPFFRLIALYRLVRWHNLSLKTAKSFEFPFFKPKVVNIFDEEGVIYETVPKKRHRLVHRIVFLANMVNPTNIAASILAA